MRKKSVDKKQLVKQLASFGLNNVEIGICLDCDESNIRKNYEKEVSQGRNDLIQKLRKKQIDTALNGNVTMLIWLGKNILGQKDSIEVDELNTRETKIYIGRELLKDVGVND